MKLVNLLNGVEVIDVFGNRDIDILGLEINASKMEKGGLFIALNGTNTDGNDFAPLAVKYGAVAVVSEKKISVNATLILVKDCRIALSIISANFYNNANKKLDIIGVTGTNGKTSTAHIIYNILNKNNINCGLIGTLGIYYNNKCFSNSLTTPDPIELNKTFLDMVKSGVKVVVMEVSAHALYFNKVYGIAFNTVIFTNLTQDHLDFFCDMESYKKAKERLFFDYKYKYAIINADDKMGQELSCKIENKITYGIENPSDIFAMNIEESGGKLNFLLNLFDCVYNVKSNLSGKFNVYNILSASTACALYGVKPDDIYKSILSLDVVSGRLEKIYDKDFSVFIDYAHTPDGLFNALSSLKNVCGGKLISLFGCGGNRDKGKREKMGEISGKLADFSIITSDNPRFEEPMDIIFAIERGVRKVTKKYVLIQDRKRAIEYAISIAQKGDIILLAGKGAENYIDVLGIKKPFNDKDTFYNIIEELN